MPTKIILISFISSVLFSQTAILKQSAFGSVAVKATSENTTIKGTVGQTFVGSLSSDTLVIESGFWGSIRSVALSVDELIPQEFSVSNAYPNPFNPTVSIDFNLPKKSDINIKIFDLLGRNIFTHNQKSQEPGKYKFQWHGLSNNGELISSGIYYVAIQYQSNIYKQKITYLK